MVNLILKYLEQPLLAYMPYLQKVDCPVVRLSSGKIYKGNGSEKEEISISDNVGNAVYIRQISPESINEIKSVSSCDKLYEVRAKCKAVFYTFGANDFTVSPDKVKSSMQSALNKIKFNQYTGTSSDISISINSASLDVEKIYRDETGQDFSGNEWPTIVAIEFTLTYVDVNCVPCDIEDVENPISWTPDVNPENCQSKAICEAVAACQVVKDLQAETESLQEQIDNLPTQEIGLIKIVDLNGEFFTDLATANAYISSFTSATITDESFNDGVYYFTVPIASDFSNDSYFLGANAAYITAYLIDPNNLISILGDYAFQNNNSNNIVSSTTFGVEAFSSATGVNILTDSAITFGDNAFNLFTGVVTFYGTIVNNTGNYFGQGANGKFIFLGKGSQLSCDDTLFFTGSTSTILVDKYYYTNNAGGIDACFVNAINEGCNVQFDSYNLATLPDVQLVSYNLSTHMLTYTNPHQVTLEQARSQNSSLSGDINANSNTIINLKDAVNPQEPITKIQFDTYVSAVGGQRGSIDCSTNPNYPASNKGDRWEVVVAGKIGGALGIDVQVYDEIVCKTTSISGDQAAVGANFYVVQGNLERATETVAGYIQLATDAETQAGIEGTKAITSLKLENYKVAILDPNISNKLPIEAPQTTGVALTFITDSVYGTIGSPETGNISFSSTGAKLGVTNLIIHNNGTAPTFAANMKKLSGSGTYTVSVVNYIYVTYINSTEVIYSINQRT